MSVCGLALFGRVLLMQKIAGGSCGRKQEWALRLFLWAPASSNPLAVFQQFAFSSPEMAFTGMLTHGVSIFCAGVKPHCVGKLYLCLYSLAGQGWRCSAVPTLPFSYPSELNNSSPKSHSWHQWDHQYSWTRNPPPACFNHLGWAFPAWWTFTEAKRTSCQECQLCHIQSHWWLAVVFFACELWWCHS